MGRRCPRAGWTMHGSAGMLSAAGSVFLQCPFAMAGAHPGEVHASPASGCQLPSGIPGTGVKAEVGVTQ